MVVPCSFCEPLSLPCKMAEGVSRCSECVRRGRSCDGSGVTVTAAQTLIREKRRLEREEDEAEGELLRTQQQFDAELSRLQQQLNERVARLARLRRQRKAVISRGQEMIRRGLRSLDELEEADRSKSGAAIDVQLSGGVDVLDWNAIFPDEVSSSVDTASTTLGS